MMKTKRMLLIGGVVLGVTGGFGLAQDKPGAGTQPKPMASREAKTSVSKPSAARVPDYPVIGHIERRDRTIMIKSGPKGALYSVKNAEGKVLFENLSAEQLRAQAPDLHEFIKTAVAGYAGKNRVVTDASVRTTGAPR